MISYELPFDCKDLSILDETKCRKLKNLCAPVNAKCSRPENVRIYAKVSNFTYDACAINIFIPDVYFTFLATHLFLNFRPSTWKPFRFSFLSFRNYLSILVFCWIISFSVILYTNNAQITKEKTLQLGFCTIQATLGWFHPDNYKTNKQKKREKNPKKNAKRCTNFYLLLDLPPHCYRLFQELTYFIQHKMQTKK